MITLSDIKHTLNNNNPKYTEELALKSKALTQQYFGRAISLYAPIYLSNFCSSDCTYCGFKSKNKINRFKLTEEQMHAEMKHLSNQGIENILMLTGESYKATPLAYLKTAIQIAKLYFPSISLEVHPMGVEEYTELFIAGADGVTVYQETYNRTHYKEVHLSGIKSDYDFRYGAPERAAQGGIRTISLGVLLGLSNIAEDVYQLFKHLRYLERRYPGVEYSLSFPRFQPIKGENFTNASVDDITFIKILCLTRLVFPRVGINLSTRETPQLRDNILELGITRMSAGSNTAVGGYTQLKKQEQDPQFDIEDTRSVDDIVSLLKKRDFDPVFTDWRRIENIV
jgi:2-iminoacetate synthase